MLSAIEEVVTSAVLSQEADNYVFKVRQIDATVDMAGSFLPSSINLTSDLMEHFLQETIDELVEESHFKFYCPHNVHRPTVSKAHDTLPTCLKFNVHDEKGLQFLKIKFYDKQIEQIGRDGYKLIGSKLSHVVGATRKADALQLKFRKTKLTGMTRLELSFYFDDSPEYQFYQTYMKNYWHRMAGNFLDRIVADVMNQPTMLKEVFKTLDTFSIVNKLSRADNNALIIGRTRAWMVNCRTCDPDHFVGTQRVVNVQQGWWQKAEWAKLQDFICRFGTPGSILYTYILSDKRDSFKEDLALYKEYLTPFQLPECNLPFTSGIPMNHLVRAQIPRHDLSAGWIGNWAELEAVLKNHFPSSSLSLKAVNELPDPSTHIGRNNDSRRSEEDTFGPFDFDSEEESDNLSEEQ